MLTPRLLLKVFLLLSMLFFGLSSAEVANNVKVSLSSKSKNFNEIVVPDSILQLWKYTPIYYNKRVVPVDSWAKNMALSFGGKTTIAKKSPSLWMLQAVFDFKSIRQDKILLLNSPTTAMVLGLDSKQGRYYSISDFSNVNYALNVYLEKLRTGEAYSDREVESINYNLNKLSQLEKLWEFNNQNIKWGLSDSLIKVLRLNDSNIKSGISYFEIWEKAYLLNDLLANIKDKNINEYTSLEKEAMMLMMRIMSFSKQNFNDFKVLSAFDSLSNKNHFFSFAEMFSGTFKSNKSLIGNFNDWSNLRSFYLNQDWNGFYKVLSNLQIKQKLHYDNSNFRLEILYNNLNAFKWALVFFVFAFALSLVQYFSQILDFKLKSNQLIKTLSLVVFGVATILNILGITLRGIIAGRFPVSGLYESILFTSIMVSVIALVVYFWKAKYRQSIPILSIASLGSFSLLWAAKSFSLDGENISTLVPVLNSAFWLSTHVLTMIIGYGACILAGLVGNFYLFVDAISNKNKFLSFNINFKEAKRNVFFLIYGLVVVGLAYSFIGTIIGGLWAEVAWGRFWGWDPKENGALLVVIWTTIALHLRAMGSIKQSGMAYMSIGAMLVVVLAWIGVNLLGVGLHSYGFTEKGIIIPLFIFSAQFLYLILIYFIKLFVNKN